jgi:hypothetical protein
VGLSLDKSGWSVDALQRLADLDASKVRAKAFAARCAAHPLADVLDGVTEDSIAASVAPRWRLLARDFANGHRECVVMRELPDPHRDLERAVERDCGAPRGIRGESEDPEANRIRSLRRAKRTVRLKAKAAAFNALHTLTTREAVLDRDVFWGLLAQFTRRVRAVLGEYRYLAVIEPQKRGALHAHLASHALPSRIVLGGVRVKSWDVMRAIWRSVVGTRGGNFDEAKRRARWGNARPFKGAHAIAAYLAGYVAKDFDAVDEDRKRFSTSKGIEVPAPYRAEWRAADASFVELIELAFAGVGDHVVACWLDAARGVFFVATDDSVT